MGDREREAAGRVIASAAASARVSVRVRVVGLRRWSLSGWVGVRPIFCPSAKGLLVLLLLLCSLPSSSGRQGQSHFFRIFYCISLMLSWPHGHWNRSLSTHPERVWSCKGNGAWMSVNAGVRTNGRSIDCTTKGLRGTARRNRACGKQRTWERETSTGAGRGGAVTAETTTRRGKTRRRWRGRRCTRASGSPGARPCCSCAGTCPRGCRTSLRTRRSNVRARADVDMGAEVSA